MIGRLFSGSCPALFSCREVAGGHHCPAVGVHHATVDRVLSQARLPKAERAHRPSLLDPYLPFVVQTLSTRA
jgi:hypothetical protein